MILKTARVSFKNEVFFEVSATDLENIEFKVFDTDQNFAVKTNTESLLGLLDELRFAAESVISEKLEASILGSRRGTCRICGETKALLMLRDGVEICEGCLEDCIEILKLAEKGVNEDDLLRLSIERAKSDMQKDK